MKRVLRNQKWVAVLLCIAMLLTIAPFGPIAAFGEDNGASVSDVADSSNDGTTSGDVAEDANGENTESATEGITDEDSGSATEDITGGDTGSTTEDITGEASGSATEDITGEDSGSATEIVGAETGIVLGEDACACGAADGTHAADCALYVAPLQHIEGCAGEDCALADCQCPCHMQSAWEPEQYETVTFTAAGPFMPPVEVESFALLQRVRTFLLERVAAEGGLGLEKSVTPNDDGSYTITLSAYTTGTVTSTTSTVPVDIVLVLDQSGSMKDSFDGKSRQAAMKTAVYQFIEAVAEKYDVATADHRIALVTFGNDATLLQGWTDVNAAGKTNLQTRIDQLPTNPSGSTNIAAGMTQAEDLMDAKYQYHGTNISRQKVVIVFTDGVPTTRNDFDTTVANNAIASAKNLKDNSVTIYSIGIFSGADPDQLYGDKGFRGNSNGEIGSAWWDSAFLFSDVKNVDIPAGNRFLNYLSNNYQNATEIGLKRDGFDILVVKYERFTITRNFDRDATGYYLTAGNESDLNEIFTTISENIQTPSINLGSEAVVKDIVTPYFSMPEDTSAITLQIAAYNGTSFETPEAAPAEVHATIAGNAVSVTGFDFNENFVSDTQKADGTYGKKLIISFLVEPKDGFLGGNGVPTNGEESGIYVNASVDTAIGTFAVPTADVPVPAFTVTTEDKNVYLNGTVTAGDLYAGAKLQIGESAMQYDMTQENFGFEEWQCAFVDFSKAVTVGEQSLSVGETSDQLTADTTYTATVTVTPMHPGTVSEKSESGTANLCVFQPEVTFQDRDVYYGADVPNAAVLNANQVGAVVWMHGDTVLTTDVVMIGAEPTLQYQYALPTSAIQNDKINSKRDIPVKLTVTINDDDVTAYTNVIHQDCEGKICTVPVDAHFLLHPQTCMLTVTKQGGAELDSYVFQVEKDGEPYTSIAVTGNTGVTIYELPIGNYRVTEEGAWSWRYMGADGSVSLSAETPSGAITCVNTANHKTKWLNGYSAIVTNICGSRGSAAAGALSVNDATIWATVPAAAEGTGERYA